MHVLFTPIRPRVYAAVLGTGMEGCTELEESQTPLIVHTYACFATMHMWPHLTDVCVFAIAKAADVCSTLWRVRENY